MRFKVFKLLGGSFYVRDAAGTLVAFSEQKAFKLKEDIRVYADDYSWLRWFRSERPILEAPATIDLTPPTLEVLSTEHYVKIGGAEFLLYKVSRDAIRLILLRFRRPAGSVSLW